ncbi:hypothetical protein KFL_005610090 [Klebsormidium nitens]|uniref:BTB domain-containing protein n=1 Tax=Klebsormidium nitens TaxID=105231 RepID=A0A1Y1II99_KLENI|nr:hypothetical protein KFL_005610090 [Klebsormidium nitens]|eukprot:GAQ89782.1 hypothetical protein KFL_005610090 [Klebsormidium nitens]
MPKPDWTRLRCKKAPETKSALLETADRTGDTVLVCGDSIEAAAHSAVLIDVPYFEAKLREEWSGTTTWNLHNKLRLRLPCPAGAESLKLFLQGLYGDLRSLYEVNPESLLLQEVLSLADACGVPGLCADVIQLVEVTSANVDSWLEWLLVDHGADAEPIREQVVQVMRAQLRDALQQDPLSVEQLATISRVLPRRTMPQIAS